MNDSAELTFRAAGHRRRIVNLTASVVFLVAITWLSLFTVVGQNLDNLSMLALIERASLIPSQLSFLTSLVSIPAVVIVSVAVSALAIFRKRPALALRAVAIVGGANLSAQLLKAVLTRPNLDVGLILDNSYPSGHTTFAASVASALIVVAPAGFRRAAALFGWGWTSLMAVIVIAQGWHRLSDVLGAILVVAIWSYLMAPVEQRPRAAPHLSLVGSLLGWALLAVGLAICVTMAGRIGGQALAPLSMGQLEVLVDLGQSVGQWLAVAAALIPMGLSAIVAFSIDRLSGQARSGK